MGMLEKRQTHQPIFPAMENLWDNFFGHSAMPSVNVKEDENEFDFQLAVPGLTKENIDITLEGNELNVKGERREETEDTTGKFHRQEFNYSSFQRSFVLPDNVDPENIRADCRDGVLHIHLTKTSPSTPSSRRIDIS